MTEQLSGVAQKLAYWVYLQRKQNSQTDGDLIKFSPHSQWCQVSNAKTKAYIRMGSHPPDDRAWVDDRHEKPLEFRLYVVRRCSPVGNHNGQIMSILVFLHSFLQQVNFLTTAGELLDVTSSPRLTLADSLQQITKIIPLPSMVTILS